MEEGVGNSLLEVGEELRLGVGKDEATVWFGETAKSDGAWSGNRALHLHGNAAFELSYWCGTCAFLFQRKTGANQKLLLEGLQQRLADGLDGLAPDVMHAFGELLGADSYLPLLIRVSPELVLPMSPGDYFSHEQVTTWGLNGFWGLPENPSTPYYRTFQTPVDAGAHLYEFIAPMVPPSWNDADRVQEYVELMEAGTIPTAVAVSTLDVCAPATDAPSDYYDHWGLTHFLLDGHHKVEAAARCNRPLTVLALVAIEASLSERSQVMQLPQLRRQASGGRSD